MNLVADLHLQKRCSSRPVQGRRCAVTLSRFAGQRTENQLRLQKTVDLIWRVGKVPRIEKRLLRAILPRLVRETKYGVGTAKMKVQSSL